MPRRASAPASRSGASATALATASDAAGSIPLVATLRVSAPAPDQAPAADSVVPAADQAAPFVPADSSEQVDQTEQPRRRRSDTGSGPRLRRVLADQSNQPVASGLLHLDPILVALADSERHFRNLIEQAADGIVVVDAAGLVTLANSRACEMLGRSAATVVGLDLLETYVPEDRDLGKATLQRPRGTSIRFERQLLRQDGATIPVDVSLAWLGNGERQLIMRDVTARQRAEEAQLAEERRLRSLLRISEVECDSIPELLNVTLAEVVALSDSAFGYIYAYDESSGGFTLHSWSRDAEEASEIGDPTWTYELAKSGIWAEVESAPAADRR
jgi:PAS domain S-box-containing protein